MNRGLYIGRFQPFHLGHLYLVKKALTEVDELIIGISFGDKKVLEKNPYSLEERIKMIDITLMNNNVKNYLLHPVEDNQRNSI